MSVSLRLSGTGVNGERAGLREDPTDVIVTVRLYRVPHFFFTFRAHFYCSAPSNKVDDLRVSGSNLRPLDWRRPTRSLPPAAVKFKEG